MWNKFHWSDLLFMRKRFPFLKRKLVLKSSFLLTKANHTLIKSKSLLCSKSKKSDSIILLSSLFKWRAMWATRSFKKSKKNERGKSERANSQSWKMWEARCLDCLHRMFGARCSDSVITMDHVRETSVMSPTFTQPGIKPQVTAARSKCLPAITHTHSGTLYFWQASPQYMKI